jgi:hypothetical protein
MALLLEFGIFPGSVLATSTVTTRSLRNLPP